MNSEKIVRVWRLAYLKLFDDCGNISFKEYECFGDKKNTYDCKRIFWRFYWII